MKITRLDYMLDKAPWLASDTITIHEASLEDAIAGLSGYLTTYIVKENGSMIAKVPGWAVEASYEPEKPTDP